MLAEILPCSSLRSEGPAQPPAQSECSTGPGAGLRGGDGCGPSCTWTAPAVPPGTLPTELRTGRTRLSDRKEVARTGGAHVWTLLLLEFVWFL